MEKALGNGSAIGVCKNACSGYAQGIYEDGNGKAGKYQNRSLPKGFLCKICKHGPEGQQRDKGTNPTEGMKKPWEKSGRLIQSFTMDVKT